MINRILFCVTLLLFLPAVTSIAQKVPLSQMYLISLEELSSMGLAAKDSLARQAAEHHQPIKLYLHWSAGHYGELFDSYHINIDADGSIYAATKDLSALKYHTYMRNSGSVGIAVNACFNATPKNLGAEPPTEAQIETMAKVIATLSSAFAIPIDKDHVLTHGEAADNTDKYFPPYEDNGRPYGMYGPFHNSERWDLAILKNGDTWRSGGTVLRLKAALASFHLRKAKQNAPL